MPYVITKPCEGVKDAACVAVCPVDVIHPTPDEPGFAETAQLYVDPRHCIDCGLCVGECPVNAIFLHSDVPAQWEEYVAKNAEYFTTR